ncbi:phosphatidate cytidylyltransferase [Pelistega sp. NLN82]|uniref:Phosphatidate cytidylyltransferase n=1 Tax=Pelistega ratti TaxID=2652177 RepID=A0A6L9Y6S6_9BURK|nr:phosphatidate cytidylyltransferase [Pelistega ratti]NEN76180.1 phosphatidate cytidylyltransferase [Pelistega ratti]
MFEFWQKLLTVPDKFWWMLFGLLVILSACSLLGYYLPKTKYARVAPRLNQRLNLWWVMVIVLFICFIFGEVITLILFTVISFLALREFLTITPTERSDYWALILCFYIAIPLQYILIGTDWYSLFVIWLPVMGFIVLPTVLVLFGDADKFFERTAKIQWGMLLTIYCLSHIPAILLLTNIEYDGQGLMLLLYLLIVVQLSDVFQSVVGKLIGKREIAPHMSSGKTLEGFIGASVMAVAVGTSLWWITPFSIAYAALFSFIIVICGFFGHLSLSAVKRSLGANAWGRINVGNKGVMDRVESVLFAAPVFFHLVRYTYF